MNTTNGTGIGIGINPNSEKERDRYNIAKNAIKFGNIQYELTENIKKYAKYWTLLFYVLFIVFVFYTASTSKDPTAIFSQQYLYIATIVVPLFVMIFLYFNGSQFITSQNIRIGAIIGIGLLAVYALVYYALPRGIGFQVFTVYGFNLLLLLIIVVGFAIIFNVFRNASRKLTGWTGFIIRFLFFIPCLLSDGLEYLKMEYKTTPPTIFILFILEIALILAYFYLPAIINTHLTKNSRMIQKSPLRLDVVTVLDNNSMFRLIPQEVLYANKTPQDTKMLLGDESNVITSMVDASGNMLNLGAKDLFTTNFGLSMWIFVNEKDIGVNEPDSPNPLHEISIFKYGNPEDGNIGKPSISYIGNSKWKFNFTVPSKKPSSRQYQDTYFILAVPSQKWNQIVFNYYDNKVDLWINGNLERNMDLHLNPIQQTPSDTITIGSKSGLIGGICNLQFYSKPMTSSQISQAYNLLYSQNPPVK